jgi:hypothetical protein
LTSMTVKGGSVVWAEPTLECPFESSIERPKVAGLRRSRQWGNCATLRPQLG